MDAKELREQFELMWNKANFDPEKARDKDKHWITWQNAFDVFQAKSKEEAEERYEDANEFAWGIDAFDPNTFDEVLRLAAFGKEGE